MDSHVPKLATQHRSPRKFNSKPEQSSNCPTPGRAIFFSSCTTRASSKEKKKRKISKLERSSAGETVGEFLWFTVTVLDGMKICRKDGWPGSLERAGSPSPGKILDCLAVFFKRATKLKINQSVADIAGSRFFTPTVAFDSASPRLHGSSVTRWTLLPQRVTIYGNTGTVFHRVNPSSRGACESTIKRTLSRLSSVLSFRCTVSWSRKV